MSSGLVATSPVAGLTAANLRALLTDMGAEPGWHPSADLYRWYAGMAEEAGLTPLNPIMFGKGLKALGYRNAVRRVGDRVVRAWFLSRRAWREES